MIRVEVVRYAFGVISISYIEREITEWDIQRGELQELPSSAEPPAWDNTL